MKANMTVEVSFHFGLEYKQHSKWNEILLKKVLKVVSDSAYPWVILDIISFMSFTFFRFVWQ